MERIREVYLWLSRVGNGVASIFLAIIMCVMVGEIIGRSFLNSPIPGSWEIVSVSMGVLATIGFAFALDQGRHIRATVVVDRLPPNVRHYMLQAAYFVGFLVTGVLTWQLAISASYSVGIREYTAGTVPIPVYPTKIIIVFAVFLLCFGYLLHFIEGIRRARE